MKLHLDKINWSHLRNNANVYWFMLKAFVLLMLTIIIKESVTSCILAIFLCLNWHLWRRVSCWSMNTSSNLVNVINGNHREEETVKKKKNIEGWIAKQISKAFPAILPLAINHNLGWHIPICLSSFSGVIQFIWYQITTFTKVRALHLLSGRRAKQENLWLHVSSILSDSEVIVPCLRVQFINNFPSSPA